MTSQMRGAFKRVFSREAFSKITRHIPHLEKRNLLLFTCMMAIVGIAVTVRVLPMNWGYNLSEFDPYFQYDVTRYIVENGLFSWRDWHMDDMWFPQGRNIALTSFPGFPMTGALLYSVISSLGLRVSVMDLCIIFPVFFAALTCIVAYYLGKDVGGSKVGLLSSLFLALNPAFIGRTTLGFYDDETVGIFGIIVTSLFYLRSLKPEEKWYVSLLYSISAGVGLGYVFSSWGASRYLLALLAIFTFILFITKRYSRRLLISYTTLMVVGLSIAYQVPKLSYHIIREFETVAAIGIIALLALYELSRRFEQSWRRPFMILSLAGLCVGGLGLWQLGIIALPISKFISVLNPFERITLPLVESVQEHRPATWSAFYYQLGALVFLAPLGLVFATQRITRNKIFMILFAATSLYFSATTIRLTILMASSFCILGALAVVEILRPISDIILRRVFTRRRARLSPRIGRGPSAFLVAILFIIILLPLGRGIDSAYSPTTISSSSIPIRNDLGDWIEALTWMKTNLPADAIVASWWDYGYWISIVGEKISLADNGTFNGTQIAWIGRMFMSTEEVAINMMEEFNEYARVRYNSNNKISYVVVFTTIGLAQWGPNLFGDEVKWRWMAKIGWNNTADTLFEDTSITGQLADIWAQDPQASSRSDLLQWYEEFKNVALPNPDTVLTKLMIYGAFGALTPPNHFELIFSSSLRMVHVYEVLY